MKRKHSPTVVETRPDYHPRVASPETTPEKPSIWSPTTRSKGRKSINNIETYVKDHILDDVTQVEDCNLTELLSQGSYGYVYRCELTAANGTTLECALKIRPCDSKGEVTYFNAALTAVKQSIPLTHLPLLFLDNTDLTGWHYCAEELDDLPMAVIFMELLPKALLRNDGEDPTTMITTLCTLTLQLIAQQVYFTDMKFPNLMQRNNDKINEPVFVDLDAFLVFTPQNKKYADVVATYFPFNHAYETLSLRKCTQAAFETVCGYVTAVAGICTAISYYSGVGDYSLSKLSNIVSTNYAEEKKTSHSVIVATLAAIRENESYNTLTSNEAYQALQHFVVTAKPFSDPFDKVDPTLAKQYGIFYTCRADFIDRTLII